MTDFYTNTVHIALYTSFKMAAKNKNVNLSLCHTSETFFGSFIVVALKNASILYEELLSVSTTQGACHVHPT